MICPTCAHQFEDAGYFMGHMMHWHSWTLEEARAAWEKSHANV